MKLNKIFLFAGVLAAGMLNSCKDYEDYTAGPQATGNELQAVTFDENNTYTAELDPADPTVHTITLYRDADHASEAITVPLKVITNDANAFEVPQSVTFAAGETEASIDVNFPNAPIGTECICEIEIADEYLHPYLSSTRKTYVIDVTRVKWNKLGNCEFYDMFMSDGKGYYVAIEQRDGTNTFRLINPYAGANANPNDWDGGLANPTSKITFTILNGGDTDSNGDKYNYVTFDTWATGYLYQGSAMVYAFLPSDLSSSLVDDDELSVYYPDYDEIDLVPYYYIPGLGGFGEYPVYIILPSEDTAGTVAGDIVPGSDEEEEVKSMVKLQKPEPAIKSYSFKPHAWKRN